MIYGLTGTPVARRLGVAGANGTLVLIVGGHELARAIGSALKKAGVGVRMWAGPSTQAAAREAGLEADSGRMLIDSLSREAELEEITDALLLSGSDDFNALAAKELRQDLGHGHVYRIAPEPAEPDLLQPSTNVDVLGRDDLTSAELTRRLAQGERFISVTIDTVATPERSQDGTTLFVVATDGSMRAVTGGNGPKVHNGDRVLKLVAPAPSLP